MGECSSIIGSRVDKEQRIDRGGVGGFGTVVSTNSKLVPFVQNVLPRVGQLESLLAFTLLGGVVVVVDGVRRSVMATDWEQVDWVPIPEYLVQP